MCGKMEQQPTEIQATVKQGGEIHARWAWAEPSIWTERMLAALEKGVKGGKWFALIDKVIRPKTLQLTWDRVRANGGAAGVDGQSIRAFEARAGRHLADLSEQLRTGRYRPYPVKRVWIDKPGSRDKRPLGVPAERDRIVQTALRLVIEPIFEHVFVEHSYGFRPRRGCKDALREVDRLLKDGYCWVVDADLQGYFDSIPHDVLMADGREHIADGRVLELVEGFLKQGVLEETQLWQPETGSPQGGCISPLLANLCLHPMDTAVAAAGYAIVRYADDFVILCRTQTEAEEALALVRRMSMNRGLVLHPEKTRLVNRNVRGRGFDFRGYRFTRSPKRIARGPRKKSLRKVRDAIRAKTRRCNGHSLDRFIAEVNQTLRCWLPYYQQCHAYVFIGLDGFMRRRLRSILRKRARLKGSSKGTGTDQQRWPNPFFREQGLFSLEAAHAARCQSHRRPH